MKTEEIIKSIEAEYLKSDLPIIHVGDTIRVGDETITVRKVFQGVGVERVFLLHSPRVANIKIIRRGKVRRAKLYYLRDRVGKATRVQERFDRPL